MQVFTNRIAETALNHRTGITNGYANSIKTEEGKQAVLLLTKDFLLGLGNVVFWITGIIWVFSLMFWGHSFSHRVLKDQWST